MGQLICHLTLWRSDCFDREPDLLPRHDRRSEADKCSRVRRLHPTIRSAWLSRSP